MTERTSQSPSPEEAAQLDQLVAQFLDRKSNQPNKDDLIVALLASNGGWVAVSKIAELLDSESTDPNNLASIRVSQLNKKLEELGLTIERQSHYRLKEITPGKKPRHRKDRQ